MREIQNKGQEIYDLAKKIFPIHRSLTGEGVRKTLRVLSDYLEEDGIKMRICEVPSGTEVFDWVIPKEWCINSAYIEDENGEKIISVKDNNLHVVGYSMPVDKWVELEELKEVVFTQPEQKSVIPYVTSYYNERYGFCMSHNQLEKLESGKYHIVIDSELFDGSLTYADVVLPGKTKKEIMITSYICHPSMANNECSGPALLSSLIKTVNSMKEREYTYRFVLGPETIGALTYLKYNMEHLQKNLIAGIVLSCVGDNNKYSIIHSKYGNSITDKTLLCVLKKKENFVEYSFLERGSDERQYNAAGVELPFVGFCRSKYGEYPEYHTSDDNMEFVSPDGFQGSYEAMMQWIYCMEYNGNYKMKVIGEPQLGKRGLYPTISKKGNYDAVKKMMNFIAYADGKNDLFEIANIIDASPYELLDVVDKLLENNLLGIEDC